MQRDLPHMAEGAPFDVLVVGGGITGATIARDAALRGLSVALVEKKDFACGTSSSSSKLIHGGLRYLQQLDFALVREALRERQAMMRLTPHQVTPLRFVAPARRWGGPWGMISLSLGALFYNVLALGSPPPASPDKALPAARVAGAEAVRRRVPVLQKEGDVVGGMMYHDAQMYDSARHTLEFVLSAAECGAQVANYAEVESFLVDEEDGAARRRVRGARVRDVRPGGEASPHEIRARVTVNAAGPWADALLAGLERDAPGGPRRVVRSKGIHLITRPLTDGHALILHVPGGRHLFVVPWRGRSLVGTTDTPFEGDPGDPLVTEADLRGLLGDLNAALPSAGVGRAEVEHFYGGLRPLVGSANAQEDSYHASRRYEIEGYEKQHIGGFFSVLGGKYTTSCSLAATLVDRVAERLGHGAHSSATSRTPTIGGRLGESFPRFLRKAQARYAGTGPPAVIEHLARSYGARLDSVLDLAAERAGALRPLSERTLDVGAQVRLAARNEMAFTLDDVVLRRTGLGTLGHPGDEALRQAACLMAEAHGWSDARRRREIEQTERAYHTADEMNADFRAAGGALASAPSAR